MVVDERALLQATRHRSVLLPLLLAAPADDHPVAGLVCLPGPALGLSPRADRVPAAGALALAPAEPVVDRGHRDTARRGAAALPPVAARLAELCFALPRVADLADGGPAGRVDPADLTGRHPQLGEPAVLGQ